MNSFKDSRWRVLPIGPVATLLRSAREALFYGLVGLVGLSLVIFLGGLVAEELPGEGAAKTALDLVSRASLGTSVVIGAFGLFALGLLGALEGLAMARALATATRRGTPATQVPVPEQWDTALSTGARTYRIIAIVLLVVLGFVYLVAVLIAIDGSLEDMRMAVILGGALLLAAIWAGIPFTGTVLPRRKEGLVEELSQHWSRAHRGVAASQELTAEKAARARDRAGRPTEDAVPGRGARRLRTALVSVVVAALITWAISIQAVFVIAYRGTVRGPVPQLGERVDLGSGGERLVDLLSIGSGIAGALGLLALLGMVICTIVLWRIEHGVLRRGLADRTGPPLQHALLARAMARSSPPLLNLLSAVAGAGAGLGGALWSVSVRARRADGSIFTDADPLLRAAGALGPLIMLGAFGLLALGIVLGGLLDARARGLRDELVQRWPVRAQQTLASVLAEVVMTKKD